MRLATTILSSVLTLVLAVGIFVARHLHFSGYLTATLSLGDDAPTMKLSEALPLAPFRKLADNQPGGGDPIPKRKPFEEATVCGSSDGHAIDCLKPSRKPAAPPRSPKDPDSAPGDSVLLP